jgi:predicted DNA-binding transcriptional regulator YafY
MAVESATAERCRQLVRCLRLRRLVEGRQALADQLRVSTRTIRRDLVALRAAGEPVPLKFHERDINSIAPLVDDGRPIEGARA